MSPEDRAENARLDDLLGRLEHEGIKLGHERMQALLEALGDPQRRLPAVLIAGTNGKGSVSSLIARIARSAGYEVGLYTSPHLEAPTERIRVGGHDIPAATLGELLIHLEQTCHRLGLEKPTYFEALTVAAFLYFDRRRVDLAVLEVGLGGRLDATNVCDPLLAVITAIGFDHQNVLGSTLEAIAGEKVRIARPRRPLVAWTAPPEVAAVFAAYSREIGAALTSATTEVKVEPQARSPLTQRLRLTTARRRLEVETGLLGRHQETNLALALLAAEKLADAGFCRIDDASIVAGIAACTWPGRLEWQNDGQGRRVLIDAAHNPDGAAALSAYLAELAAPFDLLFGALGDKDVAGMLPVLSRGAERVTLTRPPSPRAVDPRRWQNLVEAPAERVGLADDPEAALAEALVNAAGRPLVICGSIYLIGLLRRSLRQRYGFVSSISG